MELLFPQRRIRLNGQSSGRLKATISFILIAGSLFTSGFLYAGEVAKLPPARLATLQGESSEPGVNALSVRDQFGSADDWMSYVEFYPGSDRHISFIGFDAPLNFINEDIESLRFNVNFRGPEKTEQLWQWHIRNFRTNQWTKLGDNAGVPDWQWTTLAFKLNNGVSDYVNIFGRTLVLYGSPVAIDNSNVDAISIELTLPAPGAIESPAQPDTQTQAVVANPPAVNRPVTESQPISTSQPVALVRPILEIQPVVVNQPVADSQPVGQNQNNAGIWSPEPGTSWQWQLTGAIDTSFAVEMYNIDLYDAPQSIIDSLRARNVAVICYFSAGSFEDWRTDASDFPDSVLGSSNGWPGERWLDIRAIDQLAPIMFARLDLAVSKGCDGVEPDNIDGYTNQSGFSLTAQDQLEYNIWLANAAHARGLSIGLKNDLNQVRELEPYFDWALNEQCMQYNECDLLTPFVEAGKAVFGVEYSGDAGTICSRTNALDFDWLIKPLNLGPARQSCR